MNTRFPHIDPHLRDILLVAHVSHHLYTCTGSFAIVRRLSSAICMYPNIRFWQTCLITYNMYRPFAIDRGLSSAICRYPTFRYWQTCLITYLHEPDLSLLTDVCHQIFTCTRPFAIDRRLSSAICRYPTFRY